jgi:hypothetical protein
MLAAGFNVRRRFQAHARIRAVFHTCVVGRDARGTAGIAATVLGQCWRICDFGAQRLQHTLGASGGWERCRSAYFSA